MNKKVTAQIEKSEQSLIYFSHIKKRKKGESFIILYSLRLFDLKEEANAFFQCLENLYYQYPFLIGKQTYQYWHKYITCSIKVKEGDKI